MSTRVKELSTTESYLQFDIKIDRDLIIKVAKSNGFTFPKSYTSPNGIVHNLNDNCIYIEKADESNIRLNLGFQNLSCNGILGDFLISTVANRLYFRLYNSDIIEYIRNEKLMCILS